ncbi:MAG: hypothetical protein ACOC3V_00495 [bacterium]
MNYLEFVETTIKKYQKYSQFINYETSEITPEAVNTALAQYNDILLMLISEYNRKKDDYNKISLDYQLWWDEKFSNIRRELNPMNAPASKWASKSEIESEVRVQYKNEFLDWQKNLLKIEQEKSFIGNLLDAWKKMDSILITLSTNLRAEMKSFSVDSRLNYYQDSIKSSQSRKKREKA